MELVIFSYWNIETEIWKYGKDQSVYLRMCQGKIQYNLEIIMILNVG